MCNATLERRWRHFHAGAWERSTHRSVGWISEAHPPNPPTRRFRDRVDAARSGPWRHPRPPRRALSTLRRALLTQPGYETVDRSHATSAWECSMGRSGGPMCNATLERRWRHFHAGAWERSTHRSVGWISEAHPPNPPTRRFRDRVDAARSGPWRHPRPPRRALFTLRRAPPGLPVDRSHAPSARECTMGRSGGPMCNATLERRWRHSHAGASLPLS